MGAEFVLYGEFAYIPLYWEWAERVFLYFSERLRDYSRYQVVYTSLYSYSQDAHVLHAFCESWCPTTNTLYTIYGEL